MGGLFDDIFDDDDFEIKGEEVLDESLDEKDDEWFPEPKSGNGKTWDTGQKPDVWNADEPWTCDDDCDPASDCGGCGSGPSKPGFDVDDFFQ